MAKNFILIIVSLIFSSEFLLAQNTPTERDIRIAERILEELFTPESGHAFIHIPALNRVQGEYIPEVGVHFRIGTGTNMQIASVRLRNQGGESENAERKTITKEWVEERMLDYYTGYASQLRGLSPEEEVRLTFSPRAQLAWVTGDDRQHIPQITMRVSSDYLQRHARGEISDTELINRIQQFDLSESDIAQDLNIFASVLETALNNTGSEHLRVSRKPAVEYLPGLGVHYTVNVRTGSAIAFSNIRQIGRAIDDAGLGNVQHVEIDLGDITHMLDGEPGGYEYSPTFNFDADTIRVFIQKFRDSLRFDFEELRANLEQIRNQAEGVRRQGEDIRREFDFRFAERDTIDLADDAERLLAELKSTVAIYGSTLQSLEQDELLMITINWSGRNPTVPERTYLRIRKADIIRGTEPVIEQTQR